MARWPAQSVQLAEVGGDAGRSLTKREKYWPNNGFLRNTSTDLKRKAFLISKNYANAPIRKERLSPTHKARREASGNKFVEKGQKPWRSR